MTRKPKWKIGLLLGGTATILGTVAFIMFCYAMGLNFRDEGWSAERPDAWTQHRTLLVTSFVLMSAAILLFWIGVHQMIRSESQ